jgi:hypothetical protein
MRGGKGRDEERCGQAEQGSHAQPSAEVPAAGHRRSVGIGRAMVVIVIASQLMHRYG